jgi:hypothetical protein
MDDPVGDLVRTVRGKLSGGPSTGSSSGTELGLALDLEER